MADENNTVSDLADLKDIAADAPTADAAEIAQQPRYQDKVGELRRDPGGNDADGKN